jgi:lipocalin
LNMSLKQGNVWIVVALMVASFSSFAQPEKASSNKNIQRIIGTWKIQKMLSGKTEVTKNPTSGQWIEFKTDGHYFNKMASSDSGSYRLNENQNVLYLESQVHGDPTRHEDKKIVEWTVAFEGETMIMQQAKDNKKAHADDMKYVYTRIDDKAKAGSN